MTTPKKKKLPKYSIEESPTWLCLQYIRRFEDESWTQRKPTKDNHEYYQTYQKYVRENMAKKKPVKCCKCTSTLDPRNTYSIMSGGELYFLCELCYNILHGLQTAAVRLFVEDRLEIPKVQQNMIDAKKRRAQGKSPWDVRKSKKSTNATGVKKKRKILKKK